jgi:RNA polymerase sigma factor (sigma-70 family)
VFEGSDPLLIRRSITTPSSFEPIFDRHYESVRRYAQARVGRDAGEEIASDVFVIAFEKRATFNPRYSSAKPWLLGIASNLIRHHIRSEGTRMRALARLNLDGIDEDSPIEAIDASKLAARVFEALEEGTNMDQRETFLLYSLNDLSYEEVSLALGIPVGTVRSRIFTVRAKLRERSDLFEAIREWLDD